jgi:predicted enzyme related to lactoylglutathione lyase
MSLRDSPLLYVFFDIHGLDTQRDTLESLLGLPVIEVEPHQPHERHGVVKYDGGDVILSLNLSSAGKFRPDSSDALVTVLAVDPERIDDARLGERGVIVDREDGRLFTDPSGHHFLLRPAAERDPRPAVEEFRLTVHDLDRSVPFYRDVLDLPVVGQEPGAARIATASVPIVLAEGERAVDGRRPHGRTCLIVFHTPDVNALTDSLRARGLEFANLRAYFTEIGGTIRFEDPSGNRICLYEPSPESLGWGSGPKVLEVVNGR